MEQEQQLLLEELLEPLAPPDASEDLEAHDEYDLYLERWKEGSTLRQRWHRYGLFTVPSYTLSQPTWSHRARWQSPCVLTQPHSSHANVVCCPAVITALVTHASTYVQVLAVF